eukprot:gene7551-biopygen3060
MAPPQRGLKPGAPGANVHATDSRQHHSRNALQWTRRRNIRGCPLELPLVGGYMSAFPAKVNGREESRGPRTNIFLDFRLRRLLTSSQVTSWPKSHTRAHTSKVCTLAPTLQAPRARRRAAPRCFIGARPGGGDTGLHVPGAWGNRTLARAWRGHGAGCRQILAWGGAGVARAWRGHIDPYPRGADYEPLLALGWRGRGAGVARACPGQQEDFTASGRNGHARVRSASVSLNSIVRPASGPRPVRVRCRFSQGGAGGGPAAAPPFRTPGLPGTPGTCTRRPVPVRNPWDPQEPTDPTEPSAGPAGGGGRSPRIYPVYPSHFLPWGAAIWSRRSFPELPGVTGAPWRTTEHPGASRSTTEHYVAARSTAAHRSAGSSAVSSIAMYLLGGGGSEARGVVPHQAAAFRRPAAHRRRGEAWEARQQQGAKQNSPEHPARNGRGPVRDASETRPCLQLLSYETRPGHVLTSSSTVQAGAAWSTAEHHG